MIDFFDEDFPLTKKQEEDMLLKAAEKEKELAAAEEAENKTAENSDSDGEALSVSADESDIESGNCSEASEEEIVSEEKTVSEDPKAFAENETDDNEIKSEENGDNNTAEAEIAEPETNEAPLDSGKAESRGETDAEIAADDFSEEPSRQKLPRKKTALPSRISTPLCTQSLKALSKSSTTWKELSIPWNFHAPRNLTARTSHMNMTTDILQKKKRLRTNIPSFTKRPPSPCVKIPPASSRVLQSTQKLLSRSER